MLAHLREFFPQPCEELSDEGCREAIEHGIERSASYDIVSEADVCRYIDLMFALGRDFDRDPRWPWAKRILTDPHCPDPTQRLERIYREALQSESE